MHFQLALPLLLALAGVSTQQGTIDPSSVPMSDREYWCNSQETQCPLICLQLPGAKGQPRQNNCEPKTLDFSCVCSNGQSPNSSQYSQTIPYYICTEWGNRCVDNCQDNLCASRCRSQHPCGAQDPKQVKQPSSTAASPSPTESESQPKGVLTPTDNPAPRGAPLPLSFDAGVASCASWTLLMGLMGVGFGLML